LTVPPKGSGPKEYCGRHPTLDASHHREVRAKAKGDALEGTHEAPNPVLVTLGTLLSGYPKSWAR
jgi:hypothetical protein